MKRMMFVGILMGVSQFFASGCAAGGSSSPSDNSYNPVIRPADFTTKISNKYLSLPIGKKMVYEAQTKEGLERIEIAVTGQTKMVMGVEALVYWDRAWMNGELIEETWDWLAQDKDGNVWYFGEAVDNYENGILSDHDGSWEAGVDGAKPGIWVKANPQAGETYRQEYYAGKAEDMVDVIGVNETVSVRGKTYTGCLKTHDYSPLEPSLQEHKYYCPEIGSMVQVENLTKGERVDLIEVTN